MKQKQQITVVSPHASWERVGAGILTTRAYQCSEVDTTVGERRSSVADSGARIGARVKPMPHFDALEAEAVRVGWPIRFTADLYVHDRARLDTLDPSVPFLWILRADGTHIWAIDGRPIDGVGHTPLDAIAFFDDGIDYVWDGRRLTHYADREQCAERVRYFYESARISLKVEKMR